MIIKQEIMKNKLAIMTMIFLGLSTMGSAEASLGKFSRACRFDTLPVGSKSTLASFFVAQGAPAGLGNMASRSSNEQALYWIHESLTTDYFQVRYYLFAKSAVYVKNRPDKGDPSKFNQVNTYRSNWSVDQVKKEIRENPRFSPAYANRGPTPLYNARAGDPRVMVAWHLYGAPVTTPVPTGYFKVVGRHFYYDPQSGAEVDFGQSEAYTCNPMNWGLGLFDW